MSSNTDNVANSGERVVTTLCSSHCGGGCPLKVHVKDGVITRIEADDDEEQTQIRACLRGRAYRQRVYAPDRLKYPLKRTGARGEGKFDRISWDEALDTVARELKRIIDTYGPASVVHWVSAGDAGVLHEGWRRMSRLFCLMGGYTRPWGLHSYEGGIFAELASFGTAWTASSRDDMLNSRLIVMWGWDPVLTIQNTNTTWYLAQAKENGAGIVSVDPRYTNTAATFTDQWIPIRPGTDAAMLIAMAYVMIMENLQDQEFLDKFTVGFDIFKDYVLGKEDGVMKKPAWAEAITGVPSDTIKKLAEEFAKTSPAALIAGIGPGRSAYGEQYHRAAITLAAMTGNVGLSGGSSGQKSWGPLGVGVMGSTHKIPPNPVGAEGPPPRDKFPTRGQYIYGQGSVNVFKMTDAFIKGKAGGYPADYKFLWTTGSNIVNQWPNTNRIVEALNNLEFFVTEEQFMTATARYADIVFPMTTFMERRDVGMGQSLPLFYAYKDKIVEPLAETKDPLDVARGLAERLGLAEYDDKTNDEWLDKVLSASDIPDVEAFKKDGIYKIQLPEPKVAFSQEISDPENHPFPTPSGKIEIYSQTLAEMDHPKAPPIPKYVESWESLNDPLAEKYPLLLITTHFARRAHTQFDNLPWLRELMTQAVKISTVDAEPRGIKDGDMVKVFNDRGAMVIPVEVTERIMPGVVDVPQGAWFTPDPDGVDRGGCPNVLTRDEPSPGGAMPCNTGLVQVEKA